MKKLISPLLIVSPMVLLSGCAKKGCTDSCGYNYNAEATKDDGTCNIKQPTVTFWSDGNSHGYIDVRIDSNHSGAIDLGEYFGTLAYGFGTEPACGQYNAVVVELEPGTYDYSAIGSGDSNEWTGSFTLSGCDCELVQLED